MCVFQQKEEEKVNEKCLALIIKRASALVGSDVARCWCQTNSPLMPLHHFYMRSRSSGLC